MSANAEAYIALSHSSPRSDVATALDHIINAIPSSITSSARKNLIQALLADLNALGKGRLSHKDATKALLAVKSLGKDPSGSQLLSSPENLSALLSHSSSSCKDDLEASCEALRCIANALLLVESARKTFLEPTVNGGEYCVTALEKTASPEHIFVLSRILFLSTVSAPSYIVTLIDQKFNGRTVVDIISIKLDLLLVHLLSSAKLAKEAMTDLLKFTFNILLHYPKATQEEPQNQSALEEGNKVIGDFWSPKLDGVLLPLLRLFASLPQTFPNPIAAPMTHVIHALITIPVSPPLKHVWFANASRSSASHSPKISHSPQQESRSETHSPVSPKPSTLDRALSVIAAGRRSLSRSSSPLIVHNIDVLQRAWDLLEVSFNHYFSDNIDPDDPKVRRMVKKETPDNSLDDILSPLVALIARLCQADEISRARLKNWLVPDDLDRSSPLEARPDMLGKCLRLLPSVYHARLKDSVGEMLFAMANSEPSTLSALVGYGNVAGFLFNKGILSAPPPSSDAASFTTPEGDEIDPITGTTVQPKPELPEMTDEEKEREVEKLLWLFDRLERTGAIPRDQNPIRKAIQEGKATLGP